MHEKTRYLLYCLRDSAADYTLKRCRRIELKIWEPSLTRPKPRGVPLSLMAYWFYYLDKIIRGKPSYELSMVLEKGTVVHYTLSSMKSFKYPFMAVEDIQIGPSWTAETNRKKGIATSVIFNIVSRNQKAGRNFYWIVREANALSRHMVEQLGFREVGQAHRRNVLGIIHVFEFNTEKDKSLTRQ